ncbi:DUF6545 domain-containing protein [Catenuloplanes atrovinosus]|uniref:DUF6545 domain-containing protein n=1 Tax=Catenuloplanes atrovinosus TaxID=137266 RepID=A0AAE3YR31_9ACTN|nr:DUF6545 domain-containing protein [Catenuloplanes atrovinosus]MDR7277687.1 hypothetical protein [Catenuloplanes atrovinosus]
MAPEWSRLEEQLRLMALDIPRPFNLDQFRRNVEEARDRVVTTVYFQPDYRTTTVSAVTQWWATSEADYIVVDESAAPLLQEQGILHELAHMLLEHSGRPLIDSLTHQFRFVSQDAILRTLARDITAYHDPQEAAAEALASLIPLPPERASTTRLRGQATEAMPDALGRLYRAAWPLWSELVGILDSPRLEFLTPIPRDTRLPLRLRRLVIESLDGLHRLRPHLSAKVAEAARDQALAAGNSMSTAQVIADAAAIGTAIDRAATFSHARLCTFPSPDQEAVVSRRHDLRGPLHSSTPFANAHWLAHVAQALARSFIVRRVREAAALHGTDGIR